MEAHTACEIMLTARCPSCGAGAAAQFMSGPPVGKMLRVDIPVGDEDERVTEFYGVSAIYALRPASEAIVREAVKRNYGADPRPVAPVDYRLEHKPEPPKDDPYFDEDDPDA